MERSGLNNGGKYVRSGEIQCRWLRLRQRVNDLHLVSHVGSPYINQSVAKNTDACSARSHGARCHCEAIGRTVAIGHTMVRIRFRQQHLLILTDTPQLTARVTPMACCLIATAPSFDSSRYSKLSKTSRSATIRPSSRYSASLRLEAWRCSYPCNNSYSRADKSKD